MIDLILANENLPFTVAIGIMITISFMEGFGLLIGVGFSNLLDSILPDFDIDTDVPDNFDTPDFFSRILTWFCIGKVPILILLILALTTFGLSGYLIQIISKSILLQFFPSFIASILAIVISVPIIKTCANMLNKIIPDDESQSISEDSFIGEVAIITLGTAKLNYPASAKFQDHHGTTHHIMVEPDEENVEFKQGTEVILTEKNNHIFKAIKNNNQLLKKQ
jgi:hypothetical protein